MSTGARTRIPWWFWLTLACILILGFMAAFPQVVHSAEADCWNCGARDTRPAFPETSAWSLGGGNTGPSNPPVQVINLARLSGFDGLAATGGVGQAVMLTPRDFRAGANLKAAQWAAPEMRDRARKEYDAGRLDYAIVDFEGQEAYLDNPQWVADIKALARACPSLAWGFGNMISGREWPRKFTQTFPEIRFVVVGWYRCWYSTSDGKWVGNRCKYDYAWLQAVLEPWDYRISPQLCGRDNAPIPSGILADIWGVAWHGRFCGWGFDRIATAASGTEQGRIVNTLQNWGRAPSPGRRQKILYKTTGRDVRAERAMCHIACLAARRPMLVETADADTWTDASQLVPVDKRSWLTQTVAWWNDYGGKDHPLITVDEYLSRLQSVADGLDAQGR